METTLPDPSVITTRPRGRRARRELAFWSGLGLAPLALGAGVATLAGSRRAGWIAGGISALGIAALRWQLQRIFNDEPDYVVEQRIGRLEVRRYLPRVEARTQIDESDFDRALERGFNRLARYIFGENRARERLPMLSPATARNERLAMTGPVIAGAQDGGHVMSFIMPPDRAIISLPLPVDTRIELVEVPERRVAVLAYRGRYRSDIVADHAKELQELASKARLQAKGEPSFAGFDPPSTAPFLRRSEVWLELA